ncbi:MAG: bifunctional phosphoribosylaminoimidazolecarboxamide formyltransferase/IMP cyclohydrolase, partial [Thermodesulfobacteriota bacterium]
MIKIQRAIISVTDKTGVAEFAQELTKMGVEILSTGGTEKLLKEAGVKVIPISSYTGFPEMLDGRVKTLHPKVHGGLLGVRDNPAHEEAMKSHEIPPIDMVVVNLYRFEATIAKGASFEDAIENIDIGGPSMLRSAAKNHKFVCAVTDPGDYAKILDEMKGADGKVGAATRLTLAKKVFALTARYDGAISNYLGGVGEDSDSAFPDTITRQFNKLQGLRYGENPHQAAAFYIDPYGPDTTLANAKKLHGKELSYNNILDLDSCAAMVHEFSDPVAVLVKHNNPCGVATSKVSLSEAYDKALS